MIAQTRRAAIRNCNESMLTPREAAMIDIRAHMDYFNL